MILKKRIKNYDENIDFNKYEFDLFFIDNIDEKESDENTYILVEQDQKMNDSYNAINYVNKYPGLITITLRDLYEIFNKSGVWKYIYLEEDNIEDLRNKLLTIKSKKIFLSFYCDKNHSLFDYNNIIEEMVHSCEDSLIRFGLPCLNDESNKIRLHVFYQ